MEITKYCKALSDETRVRLLSLLREYELNVGEIVQVMDMGQSRISRHLKILADSSLLELRRDGLWAFYKAAEGEEVKLFLEGVYSLLSGAVFGADRDRAQMVVEERALATREFFDSIAADWDHMSRKVLGDLDLPGEILKRIPDSGVAVDLGCGPGDLLAELYKKNESYSLIGVDNAPKMLDVAGERFAGNSSISLRIGELTYLPLREAEADCAVVSMVLHHVADPAAVVSEAYRILRPSGKLIVAEFDDHTNESMRTRYGDRRLGIPADEMVHWLGEAGFKAVRKEIFPVENGLKVVLYESEKV
ncbi:MAG: ArsR/SmtB family transcription factor [Desulfovibrio sp.]